MKTDCSERLCKVKLPEKENVKLKKYSLGIQYRLCAAYVSKKKYSYTFGQKVQSTLGFSFCLKSITPFWLR